MAVNKVYVKQGKKGYKEARMISEIEKAIEKRLKKDPNFTFEPAQDKDELKALYDKYVVEDTEFEEVPAETKSELKTETENIETQHKDFKKGMEETVKKPETETVGSSEDPFNAEEPNIRDYVLKDEFPDKKEMGNNGGSFAEPVTFNESFNIPGDEESPKQAGVGAESEQKTSDGAAQKSKEKKTEPINPGFDNMSTKDQNKTTKRLAKAIVFAYCTIVEKTGVWLATKDITEEKLLEYQLSGEMPAEALEILISLDGSTQVTTGEFFEHLRREANSKIKFEKEDQEEMAELLAEVLKKRGIAPTVEQNLIMAVVMSTLKVGLAAIAISSASKSVVSQLRTPGANSKNTSQAAQDSGHQRMETASAEAVAAASNEAQPQPAPEFSPEPEQTQTPVEPEVLEPEMIGTEIATKE